MLYDCLFIFHKSRVGIGLQILPEFAQIRLSFLVFNIMMQLI